MQIDFNCLLTKSFVYEKTYEDIVTDVCSFAKTNMQNRKAFLASNTPITLFYKKHTVDNVACYLDEKNVEVFSSNKKEISKYNFIVIPISSSFYREHIVRQIDKRKKDFKLKIEQLKESRETSLADSNADSRARKMMESIHKYCDDVLKLTKYTDIEEKNDGILKTMNRYSTYLTSTQEQKYSCCLAPYVETVKYLRKYLEYFKMQCTLYRLHTISGIAIVIGKNNVANLSIFVYKKLDDLKEEYSKIDYWKVKAYKSSNEINGMLDNFSLLFDTIDINEVLFGKDGFRNICQDNETEIKRVVYGKLSFSKDYFSKYWLKSFDECASQFKIIKTYFSLVTTNLFLYRDVSFTTQTDIVKKQVDSNDRSFYLKNYTPFIYNNNLSDFDNFLCKSNYTLLLTSSYAFHDTDYLNASDSERFDREEWFFNKIANNHRHRFGFTIDASKIFTSVVYSSMFTMSQFVVRSKIQKLNSYSNHLIRLFKSHNFSTFYEKNICIYSSHGPFIKSETERMAQIIFKQNHLKEQENDTDLFVKNMWQESNLSNGKIFPLAQAISAIATLAALVFSVTLAINDCFNLSIIALVASLLLILATIWLWNSGKK